MKKIVDGFPDLELRSVMIDCSFGDAPTTLVP
jgi:hypothetical protein